MKHYADEEFEEPSYHYFLYIPLGVVFIVSGVAYLLYRTAGFVIGK